MQINTALHIDRTHPKVDGTCNISVRLIFERIKKYYPTGLALTPEDFDKSQGIKPRNEHKKNSLKLHILEKKATDIIKVLPLFSFIAFEKKYYNSTVLLSEYRILNCSLERVYFGDKCVVNTINQYSFTIAEINDEFKTALLNSDVLLPDGGSITTALELLSDQYVKKITGADLHDFLLKKLNKNNGRCFYLGSTNQTLSLIKKRLSVEYPNIKMAFYSPPFKKDFTVNENREMINLINKFNPEVLFVGMTAPKQEKWTYQNKVVLNAKIICAIGAVFDFYAKTVNRPSLFWQNLGLEWFIRLVKEPRRMFKRYLFYGPIFIFHIAKIKFKILLKLT